jgi:hypothetical protein
MFVTSDRLSQLDASLVIPNTCWHYSMLVWFKDHSDPIRIQSGSILVLKCKPEVFRSQGGSWPFKIFIMTIVTIIIGLTP